MSLTNQVYLYSIGTDSFYESEEQYIHKRLLKLYIARQKYKTGINWKKSALNRLINKEKSKLTELLDERLKDNKPRTLRSDIAKPKNVITLFESSLTRALGLKTNELTENIMVLNVFFFQVFEGLVKNGYIYNGEKYIFLTASAGQIRTKRAVFVKESEYNKVKNKLTCGLDWDSINQAGGCNPNKYLAYLALSNSATDVWENFDIDKAIVVDDFETEVPGLVDAIDDVSYEISRKSMAVPIPHMDGCGLMLRGKTRMVRLPWVKGLLVQFPFDRFIEEKCSQGQQVVTDIYGQDHDILAEGIEYIFTKSQFKMAKYYKSWDEYKAKFKMYGCEACYCNLEEDYIPKARINYQMLQTLSDITDEEINKLTHRSIEEIGNIGMDYQTTSQLLGATDYNQNKSWYQEALVIYPELFRDAYSKDILRQTKASLTKQAKAGRLRVNGKYLFLSPDLYAFCEWLFLGDMNPKGLLADGEVYCREFKDGDELACLRSPHLYREWPVKINNRAEEIEKWFGSTKCIYTSCHDLISRILQFDNDGDKALVVKDRTLTKVAKRNMKDIVPLYYEMKKAKGGLIDSSALYEGMAKAFTSGNIGPYSNNITKIWNCGKEIGEEQLNVIRWLCMENNFVIDAAKTLYTPIRPKNIDAIIKSYTKAKVPQFFLYAKDKESHQVEKSNLSPMNRLSDSIKDTKITFSRNYGKIDYRMMMNLEYGFDVRKGNPIIESFDYYNQRQNYLFNTTDEKHQNQEDLYMYHYIRDRILEETKEDINYVVNSLVAYYYTIRTASTKKLLWACFGDIIVANLRENVKTLGKICPKCGKRFKPHSNNQNACSAECALEIKRRQNRTWL